MANIRVSCVTLSGFENKGEGNDNDFFGSFDKTASTTGKDSNDGFGGLDAGAWGESKGGESGEAPPQPPAKDPPSETDELKGSRHRSSRRRGSGHTGSRSGRTTPTVEAGVEAMSLEERKNRTSKSDRRKTRPSREAPDP